jgi:hypothetical protein
MMNEPGPAPMPGERLFPSKKFGFLIVGAGRGGTSLLAAVLDAHPDLEVGFELHAQACLMGKALSGPSRDDLHHRLAAFIAACNAEAEHSPCRLWGNKITTEQILGLEDHNVAKPRSRLDVFDVFFNDYFGQLKIVFILRDGRSCVISKVNRAGRSFELAVERWRHSVQCYRFLRERNANNLCIRFEDLLLEPEGALQQVCSFLGVSYQDVMLEGVRNPKLSPEYQHGKLDVSKVTPPNIPPKHLERIRGDLEYCGYIGERCPEID